MILSFNFVQMLQAEIFKLNPHATALPFQERSHQILTPNFSSKQHPHTSIHQQLETFTTHKAIWYLEPKFPHSPLHRLTLHLQLATNGVFETHQGQQGQGKSRGWNTHHLNKISGETHGKSQPIDNPPINKLDQTCGVMLKVMLFRWTMMWQHPVGESQPHHWCLAALGVAFGMKLANIVKVASLRVPVRSSS